MANMVLFWRNSLTTYLNSNAQLEEKPLSNLLFLGQYAKNCTTFERKSNVYYNPPSQARKSQTEIWKLWKQSPP